MTIFAARRVLPPDLMTPANASNPFMNETGPGRRAAAGQHLARRPDGRQIGSGAGSELEEHALGLGERQNRLHGVLHGVDEAGRALRRLLEAAVEPHGTVERALLIDQEVLEVVAERLQVVLGGEVLLLASPARDRLDHATDKLLDGAFALRCADLPAEVFRDDDVRRLLRPETGELDVALLEDQLAAFIG